MFTLWDDTSENSNHPDSANKALHLLARMQFKLTQPITPPYPQNIDKNLIDLCALFGIKARTPLSHSGGFVSFHHRLLRHVTEIASCLAERKEKTFTIYAEWTSKVLRDMCELLGLQIVESKHVPPHPAPPSLEEVAKRVRGDRTSTIGAAAARDVRNSEEFDPNWVQYENFGTPLDSEPSDDNDDSAVNINVTNVFDKDALQSYLTEKNNDYIRKALGTKPAYPHLQPITIKPGETAAWLFGEGAVECEAGCIPWDGETRKAYTFRLATRIGEHDEPIPEDERSNAPGVSIVFADDAAILRLARDLIDLAQR